MRPRRNAHPQRCSQPSGYQLRAACIPRPRPSPRSWRPAASSRIRPARPCPRPRSSALAAGSGPATSSGSSSHPRRGQSSPSASREPVAIPWTRSGPARRSSGWRSTPAGHETGGAKSARATPRRPPGGRPDRPSPSVDLQSIGFVGPARRDVGPFRPHRVVFGRDAGGAYLVDDRGGAPFQVSPDVLTAARGRIGRFKNRIFGVQATPGPIPADRLRTAMRAGLEDQIAHLRSPSDSFSLPSWRKWARLMTDTRNAKAWPRVFADGAGTLRLAAQPPRVGRRRCWAIRRPSPRAVCRFHSTKRRQPSTSRPSTTRQRAWRGVADQWEELADAAVPPDLDGAAEAVDAVETLHDAVRAGEPGRARVTAASEISWTVRQRHVDAFPLSGERVAEIFADLGERVAAIYAAEVDALETTARAIGR